MQMNGMATRILRKQPKPKRNKELTTETKTEMLEAHSGRVANPWKVEAVQNSNDYNHLPFEWIYEWDEGNGTVKEQGLLSEYLEKNSEKIEKIKAKLVEQEKFMRKIGFRSLMTVDPLIDAPENLIQKARNQGLQLDEIISHIDNVSEFLEVSI